MPVYFRYAGIIDVKVPEGILLSAGGKKRGYRGGDRNGSRR